MIIQLSDVFLKQHNTPSGRFYETPEGFYYPSVTTVLSSIKKKELDDWRQAVGEDEANRVSKLATTRGNKLHQYCEDFLLNRNTNLSTLDNTMFSSINEQLSSIVPVAIEKACYSNKLKVAGKFDCIGYIGNKLSIIDFKTTSKVKYDGQFDEYYMQTAAYSAMVYETFGLLIPDITIIMQNLKDNETYVFRKCVRDWLPEFIKVRNAFKCESAFL